MTTFTRIEIATNAARHVFSLGFVAGMALSFVSGAILAQNTSHKITPPTDNLPPIVHLVEPGDTLWMISERYYGQALKWPDISYDNRIVEPRLLQPGTSLLLRAGSAGADNSATVMAVTGDVRQMTPRVSVAKSDNVVFSKYKNLLSSWLVKDREPEMIASVPINKGDFLPVGTTLRTGAYSFITLLMPNGSRATLPSNSQVRLVSFKNAKGQASVLLDLNAGQVDARVEHSDDVGGNSSYRIRTRFATIGARGTYFRVVQPDTQHTLVGVLEGTVAANWGVEGSANDQSGVAKPSAALLSEGQGSVLQLSTAPKPALVQNLLAAPLLQDAGIPQNQEDVLVRWLPIVNAAGYRVQMARDADFNDLIAQQDLEAKNEIQNIQLTGAESYKTWFSKLDKGSYFVRVSAIAVDGLEGLFSMAGFSRVSYEISGAVALAAHNPQLGAQLEFSWMPLPSSSYWLELANDAEFASVVLSMPNLLSATVQITALPPGQYFWRVRAHVQEHGQTTTVTSKTMPVLVGGVR